MIPIQIAIAKGPELHHEKYNAESGLYMHSAPDDASINSIVKLCGSLGIEVNTSKLHCTLVYSPKEVDVVRAEELYSTMEVIVCDIVSIKHWIGHDKRTYVVAGLENGNIQDIHKRIIDAGAEHSYDSFTPHITLDTVEGALSVATKRLIESVNLELSKKPISIKMYCKAPSNIIED